MSNELEIRESGERHRTASQELAAWMRRKDWDHFATLTHRDACASDRAFKRWIRRLEQRSGRRIEHAVFHEETIPGHWHHHVLLKGSADLPVSALRAAWQGGFTQVERYDPRRGAAEYVTKEYGRRGLAHWDIRL